MRNLYIPLSFLFITACSQLCAAAEQSYVHLRGSTTLTPIAQHVAEAYMAEHPAARIVVGSGGTERGYKSILDGTADIGMASSTPRSDIQSEARLKGIKFNTTSLGYATILAVVNPANPVSNLSLKQLKDIFTGRVTNWKEVGGLDKPIQVYVGPPSGGINDTWKKLVLENEDTYTPKALVKSNSERLQLTEAENNTITFLTLDASSYNNVKILTIDSVSPNTGSVVDGSYPLRAELLLVTTDHPSKETTKFIEYFVELRKKFSLTQLAKISPLDERNE